MAFIAMALAAAPATGEETHCPLASQKPMAMAELYFGRDVKGRAPVTEAEWSGFVAQTIAPQFPDGFTVEDGHGAWLDRASGHLVHERTKILVVAVAPSADLSRRIGAIVAAYKRQFREESVGIVTFPACGAF